MQKDFFLFILITTFTLLFLTSIFLIAILILRLFAYLEAKNESRIFDYIYGSETSQNLVSLISPYRYSNLLSYCRNLLFNLKGADAERLVGLLNDPKIIKYIFRLHKSWRKKKRIRGIYFFRFIKSSGVVDVLMEELKSRDELIVETAIESLAYLNCYEKINEILDIVSGHRDINADMLFSLINKFDKSICPIITGRLATEKSGIILQVILAILWHHKYSDAKEIVMSLLSKTRDDKVILEIIKYLEEIEDPDTMHMLEMALKSSRAEVRIAAIKAVSKIGLGSLDDLIIEKFHDTQLAVKIAAAKALLKHSEKGKKMLFELTKSNSERVDVIIAKRVFMERRVSGNV